MTGTAFGPKTALMEIILLVAGKTIVRCSFKQGVFVTVCTGHIYMRPNQLETCLVMIVLGWLPGSRIMAPLTVLPKLSLVWIILLVTGKTGLRRYHQIRNLTGVDMALRTQHECVTTGQRKCKYVVIEIIPVCIYPVMAIQASSPKSQMVVGHKSHIALCMTIVAGLWIEGGDILPMTIATKERFVLSLFLVAV